MTKPRILCVDDEPHVLDGLADALRRDFDVAVATSGAEGLTALDDGGFEVVLSDMRMPEMDGATFLTMARERHPDVVRLLLTGQADTDAAIAAVNGGGLFRFLLKPCPRDELVEALAAASRQHRLVVAERVLLEQTLTGTVAVLSEILSLASPQAFGRAQRAKQHVLALAGRLGVTETWPLEVAATLSQIGHVLLPEATQAKVYEGGQLTPEEQQMVDRLPATTRRMLGSIPRLEPVAAILGGVGGLPGSVPDAEEEAELVRFGAGALTIALDYDACEAAGLAPEQAIDALRGRTGRYDGTLLEAFAGLVAGATQHGSALEVDVRDLELGMELLEDARSAQGMVLVPRGHTITPSLLARLRNYPRGAVAEPLRVAAGRDDRAAEAA